MYKWTIECFIREKVVLREIFTDEKEAKDKHKAICRENKINYQTPWLCMKVYETIEFYKQNTVTGEILERKVRSYK